MGASKVNSRFKKDLNLQIHLHKAFFWYNRFLNLVHKSFLNQTTLDLRIDCRLEYTPPKAEILCVKNGRAIVVCGFLMK